MMEGEACVFIRAQWRYGREVRAVGTGPSHVLPLSSLKASLLWGTAVMNTGNQ